MVVRASAESRRTFLSSLAAGVALVAANSAQALSPVDLKDDRAVVAKGFMNTYEARNGSLPQDVRDGSAAAKGDIEFTKNRVKLSEARIDAELEDDIKKNYWVNAREQLRRQIGTLRMDLNTLASAKAGKEDKKKALALRQDFLTKIEDLDFALREKDEGSALTKLVTAKAALDSVLSFVL